MAYRDPLTTSTRPRLVVLKGALPLEPSQMQALKSAFDVFEVHSAAAARKLLDGSVGGVVVCAPGDHLVVEGEPLPNPSVIILERIGEGIGVVDQNGALSWTDARFKMCDEDVRSAFVKVCREAIELFNRPLSQAEAETGGRRRPRRFSFTTDEQHYQVIVSPASLDQAQDRVTTVVGVLWDVTASRRQRDKLAAIEAAGADLLRIEPASIGRASMVERLKQLEQKIVHGVKEVLGFENFEVRLIDKESGQLELVIASNIAPLKIGEVLYARAEGNGISGYVAATGKSYIAPNAKDDPLYREGLENAASSLTVPLVLPDRVIGTFNIESLKPSAFDEEDQRFAELFGRSIAAAMNVLDLLVVERYTTNQQVAENLISELSLPLEELDREIGQLRSSHEAEESVRDAADRLLKSVAHLRTQLRACASGPRTILGAEQELHRCEPDPMLVNKRILIADDEPAIRDTLNTILTQKGCAVTVCKNGAETIEVLQASAREGRLYDLVLSDIRMPDRNGYEVYRTAKAIDPETPVILMTGFGYDPHHCIVRASQEGLGSFLFKPFKAGQLLDVMTKALAARH